MARVLELLASMEKTNDAFTPHLIALEKQVMFRTKANKLHYAEVESLSKQLEEYDITLPGLEMVSEELTKLHNRLDKNPPTPLSFAFAAAARTPSTQPAAPKPPKQSTQEKIATPSITI